MKISGVAMETVLNGILSPQGSTSERMAAIAELYSQADETEKQEIALQLARVAITSADIVSAVAGRR